VHWLNIFCLDGSRSEILFADVGNPVFVQLFCKKRRSVCCRWLHFVSSRIKRGLFFFTKGASCATPIIFSI